MKLFPLLTAALVCVVLYFAILDRETLVSFAERYVPQPNNVSTELAEVDDGVAPAADDGLISVVVRRSEAQVTENAVQLRGRTEALRLVDVASETSGRIISTPIRAGAFVNAGQVMCEIDPGTSQTALEEAMARLGEAEARVPEAEARVPEAQARLPEARALLAQAEAQLTSAEIDGNAATRLAESGFGSDTRAASATAGVAAAEAGVESAMAAVQGAQAGVQGAEAGVQSALAGVRAAEAAVTRAEEAIEQLTIRAPFSGLLETDTAELGALMQPGTICATIIQLDPIKLVGFVPEAQVDRIRVGATAGAQLASGQQVQGEVTFLSRSADERTRTFRVEITVPNSNLEIRDGQTADILVRTDGTPAHLLPASALTLNDEGLLGVRIVDGGVVQFVEVQMIRDTARGVLLAGLPDQADVIVVGQDFVTAGVEVATTFEELTQ
ncbi:efflux RND transporter periplasmic adaptor subunit [Jannaschia sp. CCS1]|uniref:efflux RND transporter periplasmic adaptor subunit n=1 Tax=Jannaschia sp. (strain CCS1) TaxID=290400 RepID=UPI0002F7D1BC|nr:efflux RND transporter periplasmic adaptor subunit [Jannaschia sp. CCS1]